MLSVSSQQRRERSLGGRRGSKGGILHRMLMEIYLLVQGFFSEDLGQSPCFRCDHTFVKKSHDEHYPKIQHQHDAFLLQLMRAFPFLSEQGTD